MKDPYSDHDLVDVTCTGCGTALFINFCRKCELILCTDCRTKITCSSNVVESRK